MRRRAVEDAGWTYNYVRLILRLGRAVAAKTGDEWMLDFYGPPGWKARVDAEEPRAGGELEEEVHAAGEALGHQGFEPRRAAYLEKHLRALETVARRLAGERFPLVEEAERLFDLHVGWISEVTFEEAHALYDAALPGNGEIRARLLRWKGRHELPREKATLLPALFERAIAEARRRTEAIVGLPQGEEVSFGALSGEPFLALAEYRGGLRSRVLVSTDRPFNLAELLYVACHEGYPGHLAEIVLKERHLAEEKGYAEELASFLPMPRFVVSEGLALWAREAVFPGDEEQAWLEEHAYPEAGIEPGGGELPKILAAKDALWGARCNAALMLDEGRSQEEAARYLARWALLDEEEARRAVPSLRRPFAEAYVFCYHHGRKLLESGMRGPDPGGFVRKLLTEQVLPSDLDRRERKSTPT